MKAKRKRATKKVATKTKTRGHRITVVKLTTEDSKGRTTIEISEIV